MGTSKTAPSSWMINDGNGKTSVHAGPGGWYVTRPDGTEELLQPCKGAVEAIANPAGISSVKNDTAGNYILGSFYDFKVFWDEPVNITVAGGIPRIAIKVGKQATLGVTLADDIIESVTVVDGGSGYAIGDPITIAGVGGDATAEVLTVGAYGNILTTNVTDGGSGYVLASTTATAADTATTKYASLIGGAKSRATRSTFRFTADATLGEINQVTTSVSLNGGTILSSDDGVTAATLTFPADYDQPSGGYVV